MRPSHTRVATRYLESGAVLTFPGAERRKPRVPQYKIGGRKYNLSTDGGAMGDLAEELVQDDRIIRGPVRNKWKYLWVVDTDKGFVSMWRVHDGNEKAGGRASHFMRDLAKLDKRGELNQVGNREFRIIEKHFRRIEQEHNRSLEEYARSLGGDYQARVNEIAQEFFDKKIKRGLERALRDMRRGVIPLGFKLNDRILDFEDERAQMRSHIISEHMREFTSQAIEKYMEQEHGIDPHAEGVDWQAAHWAWGDVSQDMWRRYKLF